MWRTRVGYAGGTSADPTYRRIGDHTECFQVDFDPSAVSYDDLLQLFWASHDPTSPSYSRQYASIVLAADEAQLARAEVSRDRIETVLRRPVLTRIEPLARFYVAEDYHQKYYLRSDRILAAEFRAMYSDEARFVGSTAAARVNGFLDGAGECGLLVRELPDYGLSPEASARLKSRCSG